MSGKKANLWDRITSGGRGSKYSCPNCKSDKISYAPKVVCTCKDCGNTFEVTDTGLFIICGVGLVLLTAEGYLLIKKAMLGVV